MKKLILPIAALYLLAGCASRNANLPTTKNVDLDKYLGDWYEIARYPLSFEEGCKNIKANYSLKVNGHIKIINTCIDIKTGEPKLAKASGYSTDETNAKLKVTFFWPFYANYWILDLADDYSWAVVGEPKRKYFWILSREKTLDKKIKDEILVKMPNFGYDPSRLIWTIQE